MTPQPPGLFTGKACSVTIANPQTIEEKHFLQSSTFLQFDIKVMGGVNSLVSRRDQDFNEVHEYLTVMYPNVLVASLPKRQ